MVLKKILMASLAAGVLTLNAPAAFAATHGGCDFVQSDDPTGQEYSGVAYGYAIDDSGARVRIRCYITVNDQPVWGAEASGSGVGVAVAVGTISFEVADGASIKMCTEINGVTVDCGESTQTQIPPQEVTDALDDVLQVTAGLHLIICGALQTAGAPALINSTTTVTTISMDPEDCDLYVRGERVIDFVPYGA